MAEKNKGGRPRHKPSDALRRQVESMAGFGIPELDIARSVGISDVTLRKYYRDELDNGVTKANSAVAQSLYKKATGDGSGAVPAAIFWMKTRAGWRETSVHDHQSSDGSMTPKPDRIEILAATSDDGKDSPST